MPDSEKCRFEDPQDKPTKLKEILTEAIESQSITFAVLEKAGQEVHQYVGSNTSRESVYILDVQENWTPPTYRKE